MKRTLTDAMFVEAEKKSARTKTPITEINFDAKTLEEFGFKFNADEKLVRLDDSPFAFVNQSTYNSLLCVRLCSFICLVVFSSQSLFDAVCRALRKVGGFDCSRNL
jgi:hypothetical protein